MDISQKYVQINTELSTDQATVVNAMSGRQGDNKREVFFQLKDGQFPHNLSGQDVRLVVKDAKGQLKVLSGMNNVSNLALGRFSMLIPWNFYVAAGDILDGYLQVTEGDKVISTIPIHYTVYTNQGTFVQTDDTMFLSDVQKLVDDVNSRFKSTTQNLDAMETATKLLQQALDNVTNQIKSTGVVTESELAGYVKKTDNVGNNLLFKTITKNVNGVEFKFSRTGPLVYVSAKGSTNAETGNIVGLTPIGYRPESVAVLTVVGNGIDGSMFINDVGGTYMPNTIPSGNMFRASGSYLTMDPMPS